jgi:hypothetical protein
MKTTQPKKRGRPVGSKTRSAIKLNDKPFMFSEKQQKIFAKKVKEVYDLDTPDSQATAQQVKDWSRFKPQGEINEEPINYWKYGFIAIFMGMLIVMILSTPPIIKLAEICSK